MTTEKPKTKSSSITFRLTAEEKALAEAKVEQAGYETISAFVRDYLINEQPKEKIAITPETFEIMSVLTQLSAEVNKGTTRPLANALISKLSQIVMGMKS
ncbi:plasmid mobilization protein [Ectopseudomonas oleovorans]|uniref:plasmid mobilization protein n=1 Tax=Ectopseudomonas oleovorans TaxID=301 RepID=UPI0035AFADBD